MDDTKVMESGKRRTFSDEFKQHAVRLIAAVRLPSGGQTPSSSRRPS